MRKQHHEEDYDVRAEQQLGCARIADLKITRLDGPELKPSIDKEVYTVSGAPTVKILFYPYHLGYMSTHQAISPVTGVPMSVPYTMTDMEKDLHGVTHNVGNAIHVEAPARMLDYDQSGSASTFLLDMARGLGNDPVAVARDISSKFDFVIVSEANVFRLHGRNKEESEKRTGRLRINADILDSLTIPFAVIGAGMQSLPPYNLDDFDANIAYFIRTIAKKAALIGVRGRATRDWLSRVGVIQNVKALGCPSLFLYPNNIRNIEYKYLDQDTKLLTAGYLNPNYVKHARQRVNLVSELASSYTTDFVMQDDFYQLFEGEKVSPYNEANGRVDRNAVITKLQSIDYDASKLENFYHFRNSYAWRSFSSNYDAYIGDRLHGGICAMQAGIPAVILHADLRVKEIADLFLFPSISVKDAIANGIGFVAQRPGEGFTL